MWKRDFSIFYPGSESYPACTVIAINLAHLLAAGINRNLGVRVFRLATSQSHSLTARSNTLFIIYCTMQSTCPLHAP